MTLIDTPGLNDPETGRSDKNINIEIIKNLSNQLKDHQQGISSLILCVMPNASERITETAIKGMNSMLFMFNSLDERTDITLHPKVHIVFNNVSRYGENYDVDQAENNPETYFSQSADSLSIEERIQEMKSQLTKIAVDFYLPDKISDDTRIGKDTWKDIKVQVCGGESYEKESWFTDLTEHQQTLIKDLKQIQLAIGVNKAIEPQWNSVRIKFI